MIPSDCKRPGVLLSGGLDSAYLLTYLVGQRRELPWCCFTLPKFDGALTYAPSVVDWVNRRFDCCISPTITVGNPRQPYTAGGVSQVIWYELHRNSVDYCFTGNHRNPDTIDGGPVQFDTNRDSRIIIPFETWTKADIVQRCVSEHLEDLFVITHTCVAQAVGRCGQCFSCRERNWAFAMNGIKDPGEL